MTGQARTHLVLIPSFNTGAVLTQTVQAARRHWDQVWIVVDGSTDGSDAPVLRMADAVSGVRVLRLARNSGKGAAILHGLRAAKRAGFSHVLTMDADGQHRAECIPTFMRTSAANPGAMILGVPVFGPDAPWERVRGRRISNWWAALETAPGRIGDALFGFRVYPIAPLLAEMETTRWMRRFDFEPEAAVRLVWRGVPAINCPAPVRYLRAEEGGVSHFRYLRDNALLTWMHVRLVVTALGRRLSAPERRRG